MRQTVKPFESYCAYKDYPKEIHMVLQITDVSPTTNGVTIREAFVSEIQTGCVVFFFSNNHISWPNQHSNWSHFPINFVLFFDRSFIVKLAHDGEEKTCVFALYLNLCEFVPLCWNAWSPDKAWACKQQGILFGEEQTSAGIWFCFVVSFSFSSAAEKPTHIYSHWTACTQTHNPSMRALL